MIAMRRNRPLALLGSSLGLLVVACQFEPQTPDLVYSLNEKELALNSDLASDANGQARLAGALEFLFGTPQAPSYSVSPDWVDDGINPADFGYNALYDDEAAWDELIDGNRRAFARQLAVIEDPESTFEDMLALPEPLYAEDLWESWQAHLYEVPLREGVEEASASEEGEDAESDDAPAFATNETADPDGVFFTDDDGNDVTWRDEALYLWENWYPSLATSAKMYRTQCWHCHGASGGGDGSTAEFLNPLPRDYRHGTFKFTALNNKARPRHKDLMRILTEGVYTTAMPSFRRFSDAQISGLADYVRLLAMRGEVERLMISDYDPDEGIHFENLQENYEFVVERWMGTEEELIVFDGEVPRSTPERVARGRELYLSDKAANCVKCHGDRGLGDGESVKNNPEDAIDDWGNEIKPRNLTSNVYRFGRRPIDIYRRIYAGINGTPMPAHYDMQITDSNGETRNMTEDDIWDLVFYVRSLALGDEHAEEHGEDHDAGHDEDAHEEGH